MEGREDMLDSRHKLSFSANDYTAVLLAGVTPARSIKPISERAFLDFSGSLDTTNGRAFCALSSVLDGEKVQAVGLGVFEFWVPSF